MYIKQQIFTAMLMLFVIAAQTTAVQGANGCDMDMHQMDAPQTEMGHMEHGQMKHDTMVMDKSDMSCCDTDPACAMDCSFVMASIITEQTSIDVALPHAVKIMAPSEALVSRSLTSLFRPPILA